MKKRRKVKIQVDMPGDILDFYKKVAKLADCSTEQAMLVIIAIETIRTTDE